MFGDVRCYRLSLSIEEKEKDILSFTEYYYSIYIYKYTHINIYILYIYVRFIDHFNKYEYDFVPLLIIKGANDN